MTSNHPANPAIGISSRRATAAGIIGVIAASGAVSGWLIGVAARSVSGNQNAPWIIGRAAGVTSYLLLVMLVMMGLVLSHPWRTKVRRPSSATRMRVHVSLAVFTLAFTVLHIVVLATDEYAGVGWAGAFLPMASTFRPVPVTLGVIGLYAGLFAGLTAAFSGYLPVRLWWPVHKVAALGLVLVWIHGVLAGSDTTALRVFYIATGAAVVILAISRYAARTPADLIDELTRTPQVMVRDVRHKVDSGKASR